LTNKNQQIPRGGRNFEGIGGIEMAYETVLRTNYPDPESSQAVAHYAKDHYIDFQNFVIPMERMHNSNLHDWGVARGLEVRGSIGETQVIVNPGVAIDISGQLVSLSSNGQGANDPKDPTDATKAVSVPVPISTKSYAGKTEYIVVYVTIQFSEISQNGSLNLSRMKQVPWVRLQCVDDYDYEKDPVAAVRYQATLSNASGNTANVTSADDAVNFKPGDIISLVQDSMRERAVICSISGEKIIFEEYLKNSYTGGTIQIADLIPQQKDIRLANTTSIEPGTYINIIQNNIAEFRVVQSVDQNNFITLTQGLVNTYAMENTDIPVNIEIVEKSIVLAIAVIDEEGKLAELVGNPADLKPVDKLPKYHRRLIGESVEELRIQRSGNVEGIVEGIVQNIVTGKIGPGDGGGLKITVPDAKDNVLFSREAGGDFKSLGINANVGIGTTNPSAKLNVDPQGRGGIVIGNPNTSAGGYTSLIMEISEKKGGYASLNCLKSSGSSGGDICLNPQGHNVGIGTTSPSARLEVNGNIKADASELGTLVVKGKVGIGTTDPDCALHVNGTKIKLGSEKEGQLLIAGENNFLFLEANGSNDTGTVSELTICGNSIRNIPTLKLSADNTFFGGSITVPGIINSNQNLLVQGNVGIGTTDPKGTLDVYGQIRLFGQNAFQGSDPFLRINPNNNFPSGTHFAYRASFYRGITTGDWWDVEPGKGNLLVQGNVGIGTINPSARLEVDGDIKGKANLVIDGNIGIEAENPEGTLSMPYFIMDKSDASPNAGYIRFGDSTGWKFHIGRSREKVGGDLNTGTTGVLVTVQDSGDVGIGTTTPSAKLNVDPQGRGGIVIGNPNISAGGYTSLTMEISQEMGGYASLNCLESSGSSGGDICLNPQGRNVGIGTTNPSAKLEVNGDLKAKNKKFSIDHPLRPDTHNLVHSTLEGPETAVFYRGEAQLLEGEKTILLPDYFEALTRKENRTVLLTPKFEENFEISMLAASEVRDGKFTVKMIDNNNSSQKFYWEVKAIRSDVEILEVEPAKAQVNSNVQ
jgi:hypothetical protein